MHSILLLGDSKAGKTTLLSLVIPSSSSPHSPSSIFKPSSLFNSTSLLSPSSNHPSSSSSLLPIWRETTSPYYRIKSNFGKSRMNVQIWDTSGKTILFPIHSVFFADIDLVIILFDVSKKKLDSIEDWHRLYVDEFSKETNFLIIGNKFDLFEESPDNIRILKKIEIWCMSKGFTLLKVCLNQKEDVFDVENNIVKLLKQNPAKRKEIRYHLLSAAEKSTSPSSLSVSNFFWRCC